MLARLTILACLVCLVCASPVMAQATRIDLTDAGFVCPGDYVTGPTRAAPGTQRGTTGGTVAGTRIEISTGVVTYARDASFGPEVVLRGSSVHQPIYVEVDRPDFDGTTLTEHYEAVLHPNAPSPLLFTFSNESTRLYGYWEWRVFLDDTLMLTQTFHVVRPAEATELLAACTIDPIS